MNQDPQDGDTTYRFYNAWFQKISGDLQRYNNKILFIKIITINK